MARSLTHSKLLLVDDSVELLEAAQMALEDLGLQVEVSASGELALDRVRRGERYDLMLCDLGLPKMDGWQVARQVRELSPSTKIFLLTGAVDPLEGDASREHLVDGVLHKPVDLDQLECLIESQLG